MTINDTVENYMRMARAANEAVHAAIRAGTDTTALPHIDRQSWREIATETDRLVDQGVDSGVRA